MASKALILFSGGQDSTTCVFWAKNRFEHIEAISFSYGQKHEVELEQAQLIAKKLEFSLKLFSFSVEGITNPSALLQGSSLEMKANKEDQPASTFVEGRNILMLSYAAMWSKKRGIQDIVTGVCETDYSGYPDCRNDFIQSMERSLSHGMNYEFKIHTPLMFLNKSKIFELAKEEKGLDFVLEHSHTCYRGERSKKHAWGYGCNHCPACDLRRKGYLESGLVK